MAEYIIAHDVGTSGSKAILVDTGGNVHGRSFEAYKVHYPRPDWAEQEPEDWWKAIETSTRRLLEETGVSPRNIMCVTHSTQMLGIVPMGADGSPLRRAIIWLDNRACGQAKQMMRRFVHARVFSLVAGAPLCGKDCIPKLLWLKAEENDTYRAMCRFLDVNGYLIYRSTGNMVMELTGASVYGIDLKKKRWLTGVFRYLGLDTGKLPPLVRSTDQVGVLTREAAEALGLLEGTPVIAGAGDAPCAAVGSGAVGEGEGHMYLGTSGWIGVVTGGTPRGKCGAATIHSADPNKAFLIAETETAGACLEWVAEELYPAERNDPAIPDIYAYLDEVAAKVPAGSDYVIFTPWMYGERAPIADCNVRSSFLNLSADHHRGNMLRAVYEGVGYNMRWIAEIMDTKFGFPLPTLRAIGGGARSAAWMQMLADITNRRVEAVRHPQEAGAVGAALVAAVGLGLYPSFDVLRQVVQVDRQFDPRGENARLYDCLYRSYRDAYAGLKAFYRRLNRRRLDELNS
jgi:xylulokinase